MATKPSKPDDAPKPDPKAEEKTKDKGEETKGVAPHEPYPTGKGRDPEADFEAAHGYRRDEK